MRTLNCSQKQLLSNTTAGAASTRMQVSAVRCCTQSRAVAQYRNIFRANTEDSPRKRADASIFALRHARALATVTATWTVLAGAALADSAASRKYTPLPYTPGWEIWVGAAAGAIPFVIGSWEFGKRILIQQRCGRCEGSGLVQRGRFYRKCPECGGFFPWQGWGRFFTSTATPGNGGVLRAPKGQTSVFYKVPDKQRSKTPSGVDEDSEQENSKDRETAGGRIEQ